VYNIFIFDNLPSMDVNSTEYFCLFIYLHCKNNGQCALKKLADVNCVCLMLRPFLVSVSHVDENNNLYKNTFSLLLLSS
jgi:hypothetical protein